jgi:hypothetical protein
MPIALTRRTSMHTTTVAVDDTVRQILAESDIGGLQPGARVLEPVTGDGALVRAVLAANPTVRVTAVEWHAERAASLVGDPRVTDVSSSFERYAEDGPRQHFAAAVMNLPVASPNQPTAWIGHVLGAWTMLAAGGQLLAIVPGDFAVRRDRQYATVRELITTYGTYRQLPDDTVAASGAGGIRAVLIQARRRDLTP